MTPEETISSNSLAPPESVTPLAVPPEDTMSSPELNTVVPLATPPACTISKPPLETVVDRAEL